VWRITAAPARAAEQTVLSGRVQFWRVTPTVAACQIAVADLDVEANLAAVVGRVAGLPDRVDVACFPELALTGFVPDERIAETAVSRDGPAIDRLRRVAADAGTDLLVGFAEDADSLYNATAYIGADGRTVIYRKRHLWADEGAVLTPGEEFVTVETPLGPAGVLTCYDLNFVRDSAALAEKQVDAVLVAGAWPATYSANWRLLVRARALDGVRWVVGAARTGRRDVPDAPTTTYAGRSLVARPDGGVRASLGTAERDLVVDLDPAVLAHQRDLVGIYT
jgi:predicted amidohydrolase